MATVQMRAPLFDYKIEKVWENAAPHGNFAAQTTTLDLSSYQALLVTHTSYNETDYVTYGAHVYWDSNYIFDNSGIFSGYKNASRSRHCLYGIALTSTNTGRRHFTWDATGIVWSACNYNDTTANNRLIPHRVYGIKINTRLMDNSITTVEPYWEKVFSYTGNYEFTVDDEDPTDWELKLLTSGDLKMHPLFPVENPANDPATYDVMLVGGGGSGGAGTGGGGGGGAGDVVQIFGAKLAAGGLWSAKIGDGGASVKGNTAGNAGGGTQLLTAQYSSSYPKPSYITITNGDLATSSQPIGYSYTATGGKGGHENGGYGGGGSSGGGKGNNVSSSVAGGIPGQYGSNAAEIYEAQAGYGEGYQKSFTTNAVTKAQYYTSKWHEYKEWPCGGGGGGGGYKRGGCAGDNITANGLAASGTGGASAAANTGAGGGGAGGNATSYTSGAGGSGFIIIRPHKNFPVYSDPYFIETTTNANGVYKPSDYEDSNYIYYKWNAVGTYTIKITKACVIDTFACGGGASGRRGADSGTGRAGGGGGYTNNDYNRSVANGATLTLVVGAGGATGTSSTAHNAGKASTAALNSTVYLTANGGSGTNGGSGGSNGGNKVSASTLAGATNGANASNGGTGQGTTTTAFELATPYDGIYYGGGGGGGNSYWYGSGAGGATGGASGGAKNKTAPSGQAGTGGGGGGGKGGASYDPDNYTSSEMAGNNGGAGGCGCVIIRVHK